VLFVVAAADDDADDATTSSSICTEWNGLLCDILLYEVFVFRYQLVKWQ